MDEVKEFIVIEEEEGDRLDVYLSEQLGDMSRSYCIYNVINTWI